VISRLQRLEAAPPPPPPPPVPPRPSTAPPHPLPRRPDLLDLNLAPHQETRPPATSWERPSGHRVATNHRDGGGGILGSQPPHPVTGMVSGSVSPQFVHSDFSPRAPPLPKLEFPKFDGDNPRLWRDRCEMFF